MASRLREQRMLAQRMRIADEILETEKTYVDGLRLIEKLYISPLLASAQQQTPVLSRKEVRQLFANFPDIIMLSKELLAQLEARLGKQADPPWDPATGRVGDIFLRIAPFLKMYSLYLRNFRSALAVISRWLSENHDFARFIHEASSSPECKGLSFQSYLLLPVQRIPRYKLLLEDLLRHTAAEHVDRQSIADALRLIEDVAAFVNENIQEHEMALSIVEIQRTLGMKESLLVPGRRLIKVGSLTKICRKSHQQRSFYLFSDVLLYSNGPAPLMDEQSGHRKVPLEDCKVMDVPDTHDCRNQFTVISREKSFIVYAIDKADKAAWIRALAAAITERRSARETLQMDNSLRRRIARTRRSTLMHFPRVAENFDAPVWDPDESAGHCYICFRGFTLFLRRHHCRACGKIVCNACSRKNIIFVGHSSTEAKEGRGCDQCIARLFGREALESPPGTIHKLLSRSRHSLDPGSLMQSLSALTMGSGSLRAHPADTRPSTPWTMGRPRNNSIDERALDDNAARVPVDTDLVECYPLPTIVQIVSDIQALNTQASQAFPPLADADGVCNNLACHEPGAVSSSSFTQSPGSPTASTSNSTAEASRSSTVSPQPSIVPSTSPKPTRTSLAATSKHASTGSIPEWDAQQMSARSTLLYDTSPTMQTAEPNSPGSTVAHNRASLVSSSCSTIVSDSSIRLGRSRSRRPPLFSGDDALESASPRKAGQDAISPGVGKGAGIKRCNGASSSHSSILALYDNTAPAATNSQSSLISPLAPPKLSLVLAEAIRTRTRSSSLNTSASPAKCDKPAATPTLCSLCQSDFTIQGAHQHQCSSCLSLVCSFCLVSRSGGEIPRKESARLGGSSPGPSTAAATPSFARVLSMYIPSGYENALGDEVCRSCAAYSAGDNSYEMTEHQNQSQSQSQLNHGIRSDSASISCSIRE